MQSNSTHTDDMFSTVHEEEDSEWATEAEIAGTVRGMRNGAGGEEFLNGDELNGHGPFTNGVATNGKQHRVLRYAFWYLLPWQYEQSSTEICRSSYLLWSILIRT